MLVRQELSNCIRALSIDAVEKAGSGHPGMPMGMAAAAAVLFANHLKFDASAPDWPDRDRFVLSNGHGSMLLYSLLHLCGYPGMTREELERFRQWGSRTAGHPKYGHAPGIETTTGPLGQGLAGAVGMAIAERVLAERFGSAIVDHRTYVFCGDGCLMEGVGQEAVSLAGHLGLGKLIVLYDEHQQHGAGQGRPGGGRGGARSGDPASEPGGSRLRGDLLLARLIDGFVATHPYIPVCMHLDHGSDEGTCVTAIQHGFTSVMMDGSLEADDKTPADYTYNAGITGRVSTMAHACGVSVEGEIGVLGSLETGSGEAEDGHGFEGTLEREQLLTDPEDAVRFARDTGVDALAVAMGTSHGAYKFTRRPDGEVLAMNVIEQIHRRLPDTHLVMHGSSSVPEALQELINRHGGEIKPTWGVPVEEIQRGIKHGVRKINIDTDSRMAMTGAIRKVLTENPAEFDPRKYLVAAMKEMTKLCRERFEQFGATGHADRIKPISLADMARRYASGSLGQATS